MYDIFCDLVFCDLSILYFEDGEFMHTNAVYHFHHGQQLYIVRFCHPLYLNKCLNSHLFMSREEALNEVIDFMHVWMLWSSFFASVAPQQPHGAPRLLMGLAGLSLALCPVPGCACAFLVELHFAAGFILSLLSVFALLWWCVGPLPTALSPH